jgi:hypothetical protein
MPAAKAAGWWTALAAALTGGGAFAIQEDNNDLAIEAIRGHVQARAACEVSLAEERKAHHHGMAP